MKRCWVILWVSVLFMGQVSAQSLERHRIAVFSPLFLDSAFDINQNYRYASEFPKFINPGLEFYEGVQLAIDSLNKENLPLEFYIYDTRSATQSLLDQLTEAVNNKVELIIAHITGRELFQFAKVAKDSQIPVLNVNLPNDGGISNNPYFILLNTTLRSHCEEMYRYLQKNHPTDRMVFYTRKGQMEDMIKNYFTEFGKSTPALPVDIRFVDLPVNFTQQQLIAPLDSNRKTVTIVGSLDTSFSHSILNKMGSVAKSYKPLVIGMPTWDNEDFSRPEWKGVEILFTTPFFNARTDKVSMSVVDHFSKTLYAKPSDMVIRGYETTWKFARLLLKYGPDLSSNLGSKEFNLIRSFDIQPVMNRSTLALDYFENKKLYFVKWLDGTFKALN